MEEFKCQHCGKVFKNNAGLGGHLVALHGIRKPKPPKLRDVIRDGMTGFEHRLASVEGRVGGLERRPLPMLADPGRAAEVSPERVAEGLLRVLGEPGSPCVAYDSDRSAKARCIRRLVDLMTTPVRHHYTDTPDVVHQVHHTHTPGMVVRGIQTKGVCRK
ncbi:MAG: hypothetical protein AABZ77_02095 [Chloroflexota bacterium]